MSDSLIAMPDDIRNRINYHRPDTEGIRLIAQMRRLALDFSLGVQEHVPLARERALALTKIEEALFWANAGIARDPERWDGEQPSI